MVTLKSITADSKGFAAKHLINSLKSEHTQSVSNAMLIRALEEMGLQREDPRLSSLFARLDELPGSGMLDEDGLRSLLGEVEASLVERALSGSLIIPAFDEFRDQLVSIFETCRGESSGSVASYIPQLARVDPEKFAMAVCTIDGQRHSIGDDHDRFCVQSTCKPVNYAIAHGLSNADSIHNHVGREPSGRSFNELTLNPAGLPHNPMINAGAIMASSLIKPHESLADRFDFVMSKWRDLGGGAEPGFDNTVFLSEKATADRNFALAYFMRENGAFPPNTDLMETLDFYFQCCSISIDVRHMATIAATLANGGVCPTTNQRVLDAEAVRNCLSLMYSCGMYDYSGEFAFTVGIPAKSGVSGALMLVVPGVCGIAIWSPRLDRCGNSVRGVRFAQELSKRYSFHSYATMVQGEALIDPTKSQVERVAEVASSLCSAASVGDLGELRRLVACGADILQADYDGRTALHLAASEGRIGVVRFLLSIGADAEQKDRWGNTALTDAKRESMGDAVEILSNLKTAEPIKSKPPRKAA